LLADPPGARAALPCGGDVAGSGDERALTAASKMAEYLSASAKPGTVMAKASPLLGTPVASAVGELVTGLLRASRTPATAAKARTPATAPATATRTPFRTVTAGTLPDRFQGGEVSSRVFGRSAASVKSRAGAGWGVGRETAFASLERSPHARSRAWGSRSASATSPAASRELSGGTCPRGVPSTAGRATAPGGSAKKGGVAVVDPPRRAQPRQPKWGV
jgi:hypothetical protein